MTLQPYPYQREGADFLKGMKGAGLFDEPGLGKSCQACIAWKEMGARTVVVAGPAVARNVWHHEVRKWDAGEPVIVTKPNHITPNKVNIFSYEGAHKMKEDIKLRLGMFGIDTMVMDEAHMLKTSNSLRTLSTYGGFDEFRRPIEGLVDHVDVAWSLTGTPMPNHPGEVYTFLMRYAPQDISYSNGKVMSYADFEDEYCEKVDTRFGSKITGGKNLKRLKSILKPLYMRRLVKDVLPDLPDLRVHSLPVSGDLSALSQEDLIKIEHALDGEDAADNLENLKVELATARRLMGVAKVPAIVDWCRENIENYGKIVVFAYHKEVIKQLASKLKHSVVVTGGMPDEARKQSEEAFQNGNAKFFIGQIQAAGTALTLTAANVLLFAEYDWVPDNNKQALKRIHRIGQKQECLVYFASVEGSVDEKVTEAIKRKVRVKKEVAL